MDPKEFVLIMLVFGGGVYVVVPLAKALAKRIAGEVPRRQLESREQEMQDELATLRQEVAELAERVDFTERLLAKQQDNPRLERPY